MRFDPGLFRFLRELALHNDREWFAANKGRYERDVRDAALRFIGEFAGPLKKLAPRLVADARPVGGSLFRIYRDTRFSRDKTPYKTHAGIHFRHEAGKDAYAPGFYLHLEPESVFAAGGLWRPDTQMAGQIRRAIAARPAHWKNAVRGLTLESESLKRVPRGFDPEHPLAEDLKRKDFVAVTKFTERDACGPKFMDRFAGACREQAPLLKFLAGAVGMRW